MFFAGDVMLARGIDQIMPHSCNPRLYENYVKHAAYYTELAIQRNGPIPSQRSVDYVWGPTISEMRSRNATARIINLETAMTTSEDVCRGKSVCYRCVMTYHHARLPHCRGPPYCGYSSVGFAFIYCHICWFLLSFY